MYVLGVHLGTYWDKLQTILQSFCLLMKEPGAKDWGVDSAALEKGRAPCACSVSTVSQDEPQRRHGAEDLTLPPIEPGRIYPNNDTDIPLNLRLIYHYY